MSSRTSTETRDGQPDSGFEIWHFYVLISMVAATAAVMLAQDTHPAALLLLSAAVVAAGYVGLAMHRALAGFVGDDSARRAPLKESVRAGLEREKALTLRSIKELEFDRAMGKVSERDFADLSGRLRARALVLMEELERATVEEEAAAAKEAARAAAGKIREKTRKQSKAKKPPRVEQAVRCGECETLNESDARFCKQCGTQF
jgi:hypothetical protein